MASSFNRLFIVLLFLLTVQAQAAKVPKFNVELAGMTLTVNEVDYKKKIIRAGFYEFSYNAGTRFVTSQGEVDPKALTPGSKIRFTVSPKKLVSLRPILTEVRIRTGK